MLLFALALLVAQDSPAPPSAAPAARARAEWPSWRGPRRDGTSEEEDWLDVGAPEPLWTRQVGLGYSSCVVADGRLYTKGFDEAREVDVTWALDARTGELLWTHEHPSRKWDNMHGGGTLSTPVVADGRVYTLSRLGGLYALDAADGTLAWERQLAETDGVDLGYFGLSSSPVVSGGELLLNVGRTLALDAATGATRWSTADYGYSYATPEPFEWRGRELLAVFNAKGLAVLERDGGAELALHPWTSEYNVNCASPICFDGRIFISTGYNELGCAMLRLEEAGPEAEGAAQVRLEVAWQGKAMNSKMNGCVLYEGHLYGFDKALLKCLDLDGQERWRARGLGIGGVMVAGGRLLALGDEGVLVVADAAPDGYAERSRRQVFESGPCWTAPLLVDGLVYCRSAAGALVCLDHRPPVGER